MVKKPVLIIQTSALGFIAVQGKLQNAELVEGRDFCMFEGPFSVEEYIVIGEDQLLITGSFGSDDTAATEFVRKARAKNPLLKVGYMSSYEFPGEPYDFAVDKFARDDMSPKSVVSVVRKFLSEE